MNNKTLMWIGLAAAAYFLLTKSSSPPPASSSAGPPDPLKSGLNFDVLTGGYCYPPTYTGPMIGPYPDC